MSRYKLEGDETGLLTISEIKHKKIFQPIKVEIILTDIDELTSFHDVIMDWDDDIYTITSELIHEHNE